MDVYIKDQMLGCIFYKLCFKHTDGCDNNYWEKVKGELSQSLTGHCILRVFLSYCHLKSLTVFLYCVLQADGGQVGILVKTSDWRHKKTAVNIFILLYEFPI